MRPEQSAAPKNRSTLVVLTLLVINFAIGLVDLLLNWNNSEHIPIVSLSLGMSLLLALFVLPYQTKLHKRASQQEDYLKTVNQAASHAGIGLLHYFPDKNSWRLNHLAQAILKRPEFEFEAPLEELLRRVHPDDLDSAKQAAAHAIEQHTSVAGDLRIGDESDGYANFSYQVFPSIDNSLVATLINIDRLTFAESSNLLNLRRLTKALEVTGAVWLEIDLRTGSLHCNHRAHELLGLEADASLEDLLNNINESYRDDFNHRLRADEGISGITPYPLHLPDGQERWLRFTTDRAKTSPRVSLTVVDITESTLQEHQQRSLVNQLSAAAEIAQISIYDEDIEAEELKSIYQPLKSTIEFYAGNELLLHIPSADHKTLARAQSEVGSIAEIDFIAEDGRETRLKYSVIEEFFKKGRKMRRILVQDISDQAVQRKQLQQTISQMENVQRSLETKAEREHQMFAVIGHELRTPAASIKMLLDDMNFAQSSDQAKVVTEQVEHLLNLLDDVRVLVNPERVYDGKESKAELTDLLNGAVQPLEPLLRKAGMRIKVVADEGATQSYLVNTQMLRQLVMNLVRNAALHSGGTSLTLVARTREVDDLYTEVILRFEDNGRGVSAEFQSDLFEPFQRENNDAPGMGLGLSICAALASKLGGSISYSDYPGGGAVFEVKIVASRADTELLSATEPNSDQRQVNIDWSTLRVLLAEDNKTIHMLTSKMLTTKGAEVFGGMDGVDALDLFAKHRVDVVITDIFMPNMDGYEFVKTLRSKGFTGPVIGISAAVVGSETEDLIRAGANVVLSKPLSMSELEQQLTKLRLLN